MKPHVCPWWLGPLLTIPMRRWVQDPARILAPYVQDGMTVLEPGPGMGFFTLDLARLTGGSGRVIAVDVQPRMLAGLMKRAAKAGLETRIETRVAEPSRMGIEDLRGSIDFALAFAMVHELPLPKDFFAELAPCLKPDGCVLMVEPAGHVPDEVFAEQVKAGEAAGLTMTERPKIWRSLTAVLKRANG
ncbi:MAG: class I SAM-dependent methyltransferase [Rhodospirillales bacterium]|nr:class I SAM-dependent methyltransferase [Rhodospirillales bacterium]